MKLNKPALLSYLLLLLAFAAIRCSEDKIDPDASGILSGTVKDAVTLDPLSDVTITTNPATQSVASDSAGNFLLENIPVGEYNVIAKKTGYKSASISVQVGYNGETKASISLEQRTDELKIPEFSANFVPQSGATSIPLDNVLSWELAQGKDSTQFTLSIYEAGSLEKMRTYPNLTDTFFYPEKLKFETYYFWQVEASNEAGKTYSALQTFRTIPFPSNEILFSRTTNHTSQLFVTDTTGNTTIQLTDNTYHSWNAKTNSQHSKIAFVSTSNVTPQLYVTDVSGNNIVQLTNLSFGTYFSNSVYFDWNPNGAQLFYTNSNKLYSVLPDGTDTKIIATAPDGKHFREITVSQDGEKLLLLALGQDQFDREIYTMNKSGTTEELIYKETKATIESPVFSIDRKSILFTKDISGFRSLEGRQLNTHIYRMDIGADTLIDLSEHKPMGTNDLNPMYSPDGSKIIFVNCPNVIGARKDIWVMDADGNNRRKIIEGASDPYWYQ